jgi:hypothetical protein
MPLVRNRDVIGTLKPKGDVTGMVKLARGEHGVENCDAVDAFRELARKLAKRRDPRGAHRDLARRHLVRMGALRGLDDPVAVDLLTTALKTGTPETQSSAAAALRRLHDPRSMAALRSEVAASVLGRSARSVRSSRSMCPMTGDILLRCHSGAPLEHPREAREISPQGLLGS